MQTLTQRKKVLLLITKSNWGGAQRYVYDLATNLDPERFFVSVALGGEGTLATMLHHAGIPTTTLQTLENRASARVAWEAGRELYSLLKVEQPDVLHLNSSVAGFVGALAGRLARVPKIIFTCHGWTFNEDRPFFERLIFKTIHWLTVLLSHRTIAVSNGVLAQMSWPGAHKKMKVIHPGRSIGAMYERDEAREKICDFFPRLAPTRRAIWIVCIAELHPIKLHHILLEAFARLHETFPTAQLICIGDGVLADELRVRTEAMGLSSSAHFIGHLTEAARYLKAFDICVLASKSESYGYVLHEAGLAGVPVVATDVGGIPDIVTDGKTGLLVPPDDAKALATALHQQLEDRTQATIMASKAKELLATRTVDGMLRATETLYVH